MSLDSSSASGWSFRFFVYTGTVGWPGTESLLAFPKSSSLVSLVSTKVLFGSKVISTLHRPSLQLLSTWPIPASIGSLVASGSPNTVRLSRIREL